MSEYEYQKLLPVRNYWESRLAADVAAGASDVDIELLGVKGLPADGMPLTIFDGAGRPVENITYASIDGNTLKTCAREKGVALQAGWRIANCFNEAYWENLDALLAGMGSQITPGNTRIVAKTGGQYNTFADAQDAAEAGDVIVAYPGVYDEDLAALANPIVCIGDVRVNSVAFAGTGSCWLYGLTAIKGNAPAITVPDDGEASALYALIRCTAQSSGDNYYAVDIRSGTLLLMDGTSVSHSADVTADAECAAIFYDDATLLVEPGCSVQIIQAADQDCACVLNTAAHTNGFSIKSSSLTTLVSKESYSKTAYVIHSLGDGEQKTVAASQLAVVNSVEDDSGTGYVYGNCNPDFASGHGSIVRSEGNTLRVFGFDTMKLFYGIGLPNQTIASEDRAILDEEDLRLAMSTGTSAFLIDEQARPYATEPLTCLQHTVNGTGNIKTTGSSVNVESVDADSRQFRKVTVGARLTANGVHRTVVAKTDDDHVEVDTAVDWDNGGAGYTWSAINTAFRVTDGLDDLFAVLPDGTIGLLNHSQGDGNAATIDGFTTDVADSDTKVPTGAAIRAYVQQQGAVAAGVSMPDPLNGPMAEENDTDEPDLKIRINSPARQEMDGDVFGRPYPYSGDAPKMTLDNEGPIVFDLENRTINGIDNGDLGGDWEIDAPVAAGKAALWIIEQKQSNGHMRAKKGTEVTTGTFDVYGDVGARDNTINNPPTYRVTKRIQNQKGAQITLGRWLEAIFLTDQGAPQAINVKLAVFKDNGAGTAPADPTNPANILWQSDAYVDTITSGDGDINVAEVLGFPIIDVDIADDGWIWLGEIHDGSTADIFTGAKLAYSQAGDFPVASGDKWQKWTGAAWSVMTTSGFEYHVEGNFGLPAYPDLDASWDLVACIGSVLHPVDGDNTTALVNRALSSILYPDFFADAEQYTTTPAADEAPFAQLPVCPPMMLREVADTPDPPEGHAALYLNTGGDLRVRITHGGETKDVILVDFSEV